MFSTERKKNKSLRACRKDSQTEEEVAGKKV